MNIFEIELERMEKRVKKLKAVMKENPDSTKMKSNLLVYEMDIAARKSQIKALDDGKPFFYPGGVPTLLALSMGFHPVYGVIGIPNITQEEAKKYFDDVRSKGGVGDCCDMAVMVQSQRDFVEGPEQAIAICKQTPCTPQYLGALTRTYTGFDKFTDNCKYFYLDCGYENSEENLQHVTEQLREYIKLAEKTVPGVKYDEDKLIELQAYNEKARDYRLQIYEMLKHKPSPLGGRDAFWQSTPFVPGIYPDPEKAVEAAKLRRDEAAERVKNGVAAVPGEKARVMWTTTRPFFMDVFKVLAKWDIVVSFFYAGVSPSGAPIPKPKFMEDRELSPLEKEAYGLYSGTWSGLGDAWIDPMMFIAKDLKVDGIVNYVQRGAPCTVGLKKLVEDKAEKELGIPVLQLEGSQYDTSYQDEAMITARLDEFAQIVLERKKAQ